MTQEKFSSWKEWKGVVIIMNTNIDDALNNKTILLTGAGGLIGKNIICMIQKMNASYGLHISVLANECDQHRCAELLSELEDTSFIQVIEGDVRSVAVDGAIDYIIHAAGITGGSKKHIDAPMNTISVAIDGTRHVLDIAKEKSVRSMVFLSTLEIYGKPDGSRQYIRETDGGYLDPVNVRSSHGESKRICECICASYMKQFAVPTVIARLTQTFGYGVNYNDNRVFCQFARSILEHKDIVLRSTGATVRNYCDAEDAAAAILLLLVKGKAGEAYNVTNMDAEISIKDFALKFIELFPESGSSLKFDLSEDPAKFGYNPEMRNVLDSGKLMALGWKPQYGIDDMIRRMVTYLKSSMARSETAEGGERNDLCGDSGRR